MESIYDDISGALPSKSIFDTASTIAALAPAINYESPLKGVLASMEGFTNFQNSLSPVISQVSEITKNYAPLGVYTDIAKTMSAVYPTNAMSAINSIVNSGVLDGFSNVAATLATNWLKSSGYTPVSLALEQLKPTIEWINEANYMPASMKLSGLVSAATAQQMGQASALIESFREQLDLLDETELEELEELTEEFLEENPDLAIQISSSPLVTSLDLYSRRLISGTLAILVYMAFVFATAYGKSEHPEVMELLNTLAIQIPTYAAPMYVYKGSMKRLSKYSYENSETQNDEAL